MQSIKTASCVREDFNSRPFKKIIIIKICANGCVNPEVPNLLGSDGFSCSFSSKLANNMCRSGPTDNCKFSLQGTNTAKGGLLNPVWVNVPYPH